MWFSPCVDLMAFKMVPYFVTLSHKIYSQEKKSFKISPQLDSLVHLS